MAKNTRRQFLKNSAVLAAGAAALAWHEAFWANTAPHLTFPTQPHDRIAVASWPFRMFIESPTNKRERDPKVPGMDLTEFPAMVVKRFGVHNIEPLDEHFFSTEPAYIKKFRAAIEAAGCHVVDIPCEVRGCYYHTDPAQRKLAVESGKKWVDIAAELGSPSTQWSISSPSARSASTTRTVPSSASPSSSPVISKDKEPLTLAGSTAAQAPAKAAIAPFMSTAPRPNSTSPTT